MREGILGRKRGLQDTSRAVPCYGAGEVPGSTRTWNGVLVVQPETRPHRLCYHEEAEVHTSMGVGSSVCRRLCTHMGGRWASFGSCSALLSRGTLLLTRALSPHSYMLSPRQWGVPFLILLVSDLSCLLLTPGYAQNTHDTDDGGVDGQCCIDLNLLQCNAHDGE